MLNAVHTFIKGCEPLGLNPSIPFDRLRSEEKVVPNETVWQAVGAFTGEPIPSAEQDEVTGNAIRTKTLGGR